MIAGIAPEPDGRWMQQTARNPTDADDGFLKGARYTLHCGAVRAFDPGGLPGQGHPARSTPSPPGDFGWVLAQYGVEADGGR